MKSRHGSIRCDLPHVRVAMLKCIRLSNTDPTSHKLLIARIISTRSCSMYTHPRHDNIQGHRKIIRYPVMLRIEFCSQSKDEQTEDVMCAV
jgi:hypothetical protein